MVSKAARAGTPGTERTRRQQLGLLRLVIVLGLVDGVTILLCPRAITSANAVPWGGLFAEMRNSCAEMKSLAACQISSLGGCSPKVEGGNAPRSGNTPPALDGMGIEQFELGV